MEEETQSLVKNKQQLNSAKSIKQILSPIFNTIMLIITLCLIAFMFATLLQQQHQVQTSFIQKTSIKKPLIDNNQYHHLTLENGLRVLLIQNPDALISQVALSVMAGSFQEPQNYGGLAHLLEHMLFVGSHTYPDPNYFNNLIASNGGTNNAYTDNYETNYYFTIQNSALQQGLDVFSHFFIDPTLDQTMVEKEVNAVNSEYEIITDTDEWKIEALLKQISIKSHPFHQFNIGNTQTLLKQEISNQLREFFNKYYSANLMSLVIESSLSFQEVQEYIKNFENIKNSILPEPTCEELGQPIKLGTQLIKYRLDSDIKKVQITHQLTDVQAQYKTKSIEFLRNLIQQSRGIKEHLIKQNLILDLTTDIWFNDRNGCFSILVLEFSVYNVDDYDKILQTVFSYYYYLIQTLFDDKGDVLNDNVKLRQLYNDYKKSANLRFNYNENIIDDIQDIAQNLNFYGFEDVLSRKYLYEDYDPELIYFYLTDLLDIDNLNVFLGDDELNHVDVEFDKLNNINYLYLNFPDNVVAQIQTYDEVEQPKFELPIINKYSPIDLRMKSFCKPFSFNTDPYDDLNEHKMLIQRNQEMVFSNIEECLKYENEYEEFYPLPEYLYKSQIGKLWWKLDRSYFTPAIFMGMKIDKINFQFTLKHQTLLKLFQIYTQTQIEEHLESAFMNNYKFKFESSPNHIIFNIYGWSDKFNDFIDDALSHFTNQHINQLAYDQSIKTLTNFLNEQLQTPLYQQIRNHYFFNTLQYGYFGPKQILQQLKTITLQDYEQFHQSLFKGTNFQLYLAGNILREEALNLFRQVETKLFAKTKHLDYNPIYSKILKLSNNYIVPYSLETHENNGATYNYYIFGNRNRKQFAIMNLLKGSFDSSAFNYLRTELQLGYVATAKFIPLECLDGAGILVQGSAETPYKVNQHIEDFLQHYYQEIEKMTDIDIDELKKAAIQSLRQKEKTLQEKGEAYWEHIANNDFIFEEKEITIDQIDQLTKDDVLNFLNTAFKKSQKVSIQLYGKHMLKGQSMEDYIKQQIAIKSFSEIEEKVTDTSKILIGALLYQCSYKLGQI